MTSATTAVREKTIIVISAAPAPVPVCRAWTARRSESTGSRTARRDAASTTRSTATVEPSAASRNPSGSSSGTVTGKTTRATRFIARGATSTPIATPLRVSGNSSASR